VPCDIFDLFVFVHWFGVAHQNYFLDEFGLSNYGDGIAFRDSGDPMPTCPEQNSPVERGTAAVCCDELDVLLGLTDQRRAHGRKLLAALICDERIDVAFRAGLVMSLGAQR